MEKTLESPLDCKEIQPVHPLGDQSWVLIGRTDVETEIQYFGHLMRRTDIFVNTLIWERLRAGGEWDDRVCMRWLDDITNSWSLLKLMSIESVMPSNQLILCCRLLLPPSIFPSIKVFLNELVLPIRWPKYWSFSFSISPSNEY